MGLGKPKPSTFREPETSHFIGSTGRFEKFSTSTGRGQNFSNDSHFIGDNTGRFEKFSASKQNFRGNQQNSHFIGNTERLQKFSEVQSIENLHFIGT